MNGTNLFDQHKPLKTYVPIPLIKRFKFYFKMIDMYAQPITLRYKNQKMFYTNYGALASLFVYLVTISILTNLITDVFNKNVELI